MKKLLIFILLSFISLSFYVTATYPLFYDAHGREVNLNAAQNLSGFDVSTIYIPAFIIKPLIPTPYTEQMYLLYYACIPTPFNNCIRNFQNANYLELQISTKKSILTTIDEVLKCRELRQTEAQAACLNEAGIEIKSYRWQYMTTNKEGNLNV